MHLKRFLCSLVIGFCFILNGDARPSKGKKRSQRKYEKTEPKLTKAEWKQIHKFEDALKDEEGKLFYTDSWAVQLTDPAEVEVADRIAAKHGFANLGKVCSMIKNEETNCRNPYKVCGETFIVFHATSKC